MGRDRCVATCDDESRPATVGNSKHAADIVRVIEILQKEGQLRRATSRDKLPVKLPHARLATDGPFVSSFAHMT